MNASDWNDDNHDWQSIHEFYTTLKDLPSLFEIQVASDDRNASRYVIEVNFLTFINLFLEKEYFLFESVELNLYS